MERKSCGICECKLHNFFTMEMPTKLFCTKYPIIDKSLLSFAKCEECNTIQLDRLIPLHILYSDSHNYKSVGHIWKTYFDRFVSLIENIIIDKTILEIGDPSGKIANQCKNFKKWIIVEPNKNLSVNFNKNIEFIELFFNNDFSINDKIDIIVHSHLLEHIYEPNVFLKKCYDILTDNGEMIFGVPNMEHIGKNEIAPCLGIFFEHTIFLNKENILYLLKKNGFEVLNFVYHESHSLLFHVKKINNFQNDKVNIFNYSTQFFLTLDKYKKFVDYCNEFLENKQNKFVYIFGASYNTQFLLSLGLNVAKIDGIIDNCSDKHGHFLYGYNLQIFSPEILSSCDSCVILKNGYYSDEIRNQLLKIKSSLTIL
jgi:predicted SAM-dependent methyltransferase